MKTNKLMDFCSNTDDEYREILISIPESDLAVDLKDDGFPVNAVIDYKEEPSKNIGEITTFLKKLFGADDSYFAEFKANKQAVFNVTPSQLRILLRATFINVSDCLEHRSSYVFRSSMPKLKTGEVFKAVTLTGRQSDRPSKKRKSQNYDIPVELAEIMSMPPVRKSAQLTDQYSNPCSEITEITMNIESLKTDAKDMLDAVKKEIFNKELKF